jgi:hypothetical protein
MSDFQRATRTAKRFRLGIESPSGGGKTYTALKIASTLAEHDGGRIGVIDSERGSSSAYSDGKPFDFDMLILEDRSPDGYVEALLKARAAKFAVTVIDSASHEWKGTLALVDKVGAERKGNTWSAWSVGRPAHDRFVDTMIAMPSHVIATFRSKQDTEQVKDNGRTVVRKLGLAPVTSEDMDYEMDVWGSISHDEHTLIITKSRIDTIPIGSEWPLGDGVAEAYLAWLDGADYETPRPSEDMLRAQLRQAVEVAGIGGREIQAVVGGDGAIAWLRDHGDDVAALITAAKGAKTAARAVNSGE